MDTQKSSWNSRIYTTVRKAVKKLYKKFNLLSVVSGSTKEKATHKLSLGTIQSFDTVCVVPYRHLLDRFQGFSAHDGGPIWPNWSQQQEARHCRNRAPVDDMPEFSGKAQHYIESAAWGGAIINHFGHQIADFSTRILHTRVAYPDVKIIFSGKANHHYRTLADTPNFFRAMLDWYEIDLNTVELITQPTTVGTLLVAPQAEQLKDYGPSSDYLDLLDEHVERKLQRKLKQGTVFVSRAGMEACFAGEKYLESLMRAVGIRVIRPECLTLTEQLAEYQASDQLIFSEGSALHSLQLLGRGLGNIHILNRRPGNRMATNLLTARSQGLSHIEVSRGIVCGLWPNGQLRKAGGVSILNEEAIVDYLDSIDSTLKNRWDRAAYLNARDEDVMGWLQNQAATNIAHRPSSPIAVNTTLKATVIEKLQAAALSHLIPYAQSIFP